MKNEKSQEEAGEIISLESLGLGKIEESDPLNMEDSVDTSESEKELGLALDEAFNGKKDNTDFFDNVEDSDDEEEEVSDSVPPLLDENVDEEEEDNSEEIITDAQLEYRKNLLKSLFGEEVETLIVPNEDGEDVEVPLDEFDLDEESFKEIIKNKIEAEKEAASEGKISVDGVDEFTKSLIELSKKGGDVRELLEYKAAYTDPLDQLDLSTKEGQREAIALYLRGRQETEDEIQIRLDAYESKGLLESKAKEFDSQIRESIKNLTEQRKREAEEIALQKKEQLKSYKKEFAEGLSKNFQLNDKSKAKLVDMATKATKDGKYEMDTIYQQMRANPEEAAMLALWFTDREEFVRQITSKKVKEEQLKTANKIRLSGKKKSSDIVIDSKSKGSSKDVILFDDL